MKKYVLIACLFLWPFTQIYAQQVKGGVFEMIGGESNPLIGANVVQLKTLNGTTTDAEGHFNLNLERKEIGQSFVKNRNKRNNKH